MGFFRSVKIKAQKIRGKFRSILREKIRASTKIFCANFVLQTCHPNGFPPFLGRFYPEVSACLYRNRNTLCPETRKFCYGKLWPELNWVQHPGCCGAQNSYHIFSLRALSCTI